MLITADYKNWPLHKTWHRHIESHPGVDYLQENNKTSLVMILTRLKYFMAGMARTTQQFVFMRTSSKKNFHLNWTELSKISQFVSVICTSSHDGQRWINFKWEIDIYNTYMYNCTILLQPQIAR